MQVPIITSVRSITSILDDTQLHHFRCSYMRQVGLKQIYVAVCASNTLQDLPQNNARPV